MTDDPAFIPGMQLCAGFFTDVVKPLLDSAYPDLQYAASRIDYGSEVLGFDTPTSTDHDWGPRLQLFVSEQDNALAEELQTFFAKALPPAYLAYSTHFGEPDHEGTRLLETTAEGQAIAHRITVTTPEQFFLDYLGLIPSSSMEPTQWLTLSEQKLATICHGQLFHDDINMNAYRNMLRYYPHDVWLYVMAAHWMKISQEEPFVGRCHQVGDELGAQVLTARLVHIIMQLCFTMEQRYAPYSKWFGTAFEQLPSATALRSILLQALTTPDARDREDALCAAYSLLAKRHNELGVTERLDINVRPFHTRPFLVISGERFARALQNAISRPDMRTWPLLGSVNQLSSTVDFLEHNHLLQKTANLYAPDSETR